MEQIEELDNRAVGLIREAQAVLCTAHRTATELVLRALEMAVPGSAALPESAALTGGALAGGVLAGEALTGKALTGKALTGEVLAGETLAGETLAGGAVTGGAVTGGAVTGGAVTGGAVTGGAVTGGAVTGGVLVGADDTFATVGLAAVGHAAGPANLVVPLAWAALATGAIRCGDLITAARHLERGRAQLAGAPPAEGVRLAWVAGQLVEASEGPAAAVADLVDVYDRPVTCRQLLIEEPAAGSWLVRTALLAGEPARAEAVTEAAEKLAADLPGVPAVVAGAWHGRGLLDRDPTALRNAATKHPDPWARASAAEDLGVLVAGQGERGYRPVAVQAFEEALRGYDHEGASRDCARVRGRLRRLGVRRRHWGRTDRPSSGWSSLTEVERTIADRVAEGLTNRQVAARMFLSPHTVAFHLRHVFRKLGITSRIELARLSVERHLRQSGS
jgi:DNA-binding CsgD family transcriptional regulator